MTESAESIRFYLAGKVSKNDWRNVRNVLGIDVYGVVEPGWDYQVWPHEEMNGGLMTGPFFVSDDHGCAHGPNSHGTGAGEDGICGGAYPSPRRQDVHRLCTTAIEDAEFVLAWLGGDDALTAYGTMYELGYARALDKTIIVATDRDQDDLWLSMAGADLVLRLRNPEQLHGVVQMIARSRQEGLDPIKCLRVAWH